MQDVASYHQVEDMEKGWLERLLKAVSGVSSISAIDGRY